MRGGKTLDALIVLQVAAYSLDSLLSTYRPPAKALPFFFSNELGMS